ncbi:MAG: [Fe-Fe] hydrogenase large subunit C-terminal domain-containing protein [Candidatus ainarchaeum sp.]|nr:[Fe-Fe] hydrogenase large subunit C-terminal domain-containing protein [Candidatus ainarchaeum sp.]
MNEELLKIIEILKTEKTICLLAPSFPVDFSFPEVILDLREIGFTKIVELTYAAKLINYKYIEILKNNPEKQYICPNCPTIVKYIENKYPELKENIIDVASPMVIMARFVKREFGEDYKTIFVGPCFAKKQEAKENSDCVDYAITYKEFCEIYNYLEENNSLKKIEESQENKEIDKFYNDVTKIYPLSGGVAESMLNKQIVSKEEIIVCDGPKNIDVSIKDFKEFKTFRFLDILFCEGGCLGGPGIINKDPIDEKIKKILEYKDRSRYYQPDEKYGKFIHAFALDLKRKK